MTERFKSPLSETETSGVLQGRQPLPWTGA